MLSIKLLKTNEIHKVNMDIDLLGNITYFLTFFLLT